MATASPGAASTSALLRRAAHGTVWSLLNSVAAQAASFAASLGLARILGREAFGEWGIIQNTIVVAAGVAQLAMAATATKYAAASRHADPARIGPVLALCGIATLLTGTVSAGALLLFPRSIAVDLLSSPGTEGALMLAAPFVLFTTMNGYQSGAMAGFELFRPLALLALLHGVVTLTACLTLGVALGVNGAALGLSIGAVVNWVTHQAVLRDTCRRLGVRVEYAAARGEMSLLAKFALPTALAAGATSVGLWVANLVLVARPGGHSAMALIAAANNWKALAMFGPTIVNRVAISMLANLEGNHDWGAYSKLYRSNVALSGLGTLVVAIPMALASSQLLRAFGKDFVDGAPVVSIVAFAAVFEALWQAFHQKLYSSERMWTAFLVATVRALALVGLSVALVPAHGAVGVGVGLVGSNVLAAAITFLAVSRSAIGSN